MKTILLVASLALAVSQLQADTFTFTTLAGNAGRGYVDGLGNLARFVSPGGMALDGAGNIYVADTFNHIVRKITTNGVVSTLAGMPGVLGSDNGTGRNARFNALNDVAVDGSGFIYVADFGNHTIRKITPDGEVSTVGGVALGWGSVDGTGSAARFNYPYGIAADGGGNLYIADFGNNTIRKGIPTSLLPPPVLQSPALAAGQFGFGLTGAPGLIVNLETSGNLSDWQTVGSYFLEAGTNHFSGGAEIQGNQFYRALVP